MNTLVFVADEAYTNLGGNVLKDTTDRYTIVRRTNGEWRTYRGELGGAYDVTDVNGNVTGVVYGEYLGRFDTYDLAVAKANEDYVNVFGAR